MQLLLALHQALLHKAVIVYKQNTGAAGRRTFESGYRKLVASDSNKDENSQVLESLASFFLMGTILMPFDLAIGSCC